VKNGLLPIRNVFRHLREVARDDPEQLSTVFEERQGVLDSSIGYLESLAENYSKLYQANPSQSCDLNAVVEAVALSRSGGGKIEYEVRLESSRGQVLADPVALRRIVDNLVTNAEESLPETGGKVTLVTTDGKDEGGRRAVSLTVADTGAGIPPELQKKIFDDFFTTKSTGAGLGLSIVRRMVADSSGSIRVQSETGRGTRFIVEWPESGSATTGGGDSL
jgi:signal transduction histidine kinase